LSLFLSILLGIGIGLATSIVAWLATMFFLSPRVNISGRYPDNDNEAYKVTVSSRRRLRSLVDIKVACTLQIPHDGGQKNVLALNVSQDSFARVPPGWEQVISISMDPDSLTKFGRERLNERLAEHGRRCSNIPSMLDVFDVIKEAKIEVAVFCTDPISGTRNVSCEMIKPRRPGS